MILDQVKEEKKRIYYLTHTKKQGWTRDTLRKKIKSNAYERHVSLNKKHNFKETLPAQIAVQADESMKDVYMLDMLGISEPVLENEIERQMVEKIKEGLLELGYGFCFIGNQYRVSTPESDYFIDLLFYHRKLK